MEILFAIGLGQGVTLSLLLFLKSGAKKNASWLIGVFILCVSAFISTPLLNSIFGEPRGSFIVDPLILLIGPSFYGYIISLSGGLSFKRLSFHTIPFFLYLPLLIYFYQNLSVDFNSPQSLQSVYSSSFALVLGLFKFLHLFLYIGLGFYALQKHQVKIKKYFSNLKGKDLAWLKYILVGLLSLSILSFLLYLLALQLPDQQALITSINLILLMAFLFVIAIYSFRQETIFDSSFDWIRDVEQSPPVKLKSELIPKYEKSGLKKNEIERINNKLDDFIDAKGFLNPELSLTTLSEDVGVAPHKISEVLSKHRKTSFYDLINSHRIEAVKSALKDPAFSHLSVLGIAYDCGYNSKSTFNTAFKKFTGQNPSEYRKLSN